MSPRKEVTASTRDAENITSRREKFPGHRKHGAYLNLEAQQPLYASNLDSFTLPGCAEKTIEKTQNLACVLLRRGEDLPLEINKKSQMTGRRLCRLSLPIIQFYSQPFCLILCH